MSGQSRKQYFRAILPDDSTRRHRVIYAEAAHSERECLDLLVTHVLDDSLGRAFWSFLACACARRGRTDASCLPAGMTRSECTETCWPTPPVNICRSCWARTLTSCSTLLQAIRNRQLVRDIELANTKALVYTDRVITNQRHACAAWRARAQTKRRRGAGRMRSTHSESGTRGTWWNAPANASSAHATTAAKPPVSA